MIYLKRAVQSVVPFASDVFSAFMPGQAFWQSSLLIFALVPPAQQPPFMEAFDVMEASLFETSPFAFAELMEAQQASLVFFAEVISAQPASLPSFAEVICAQQAFFAFF